MLNIILPDASCPHGCSSHLLYSPHWLLRLIIKVSLLVILQIMRSWLLGHDITPYNHPSAGLDGIVFPGTAAVSDICFESHRSTK